MSQPRRFAVLLIRHDTSRTPPDRATCQSILSLGTWSVARYWSDNSENWFQFAAFDFFGWYDVALPPPPSTRQVIAQKARDAASAANVNLSTYDSFIVMAFPGAGYDAGADGIGTGHTAVLNSLVDRTFMCHEVGHVLGFDHTYGILTSGADWSNDGVTQLYPVYGDPYDLMSSATFGGANPTFTLPASEAHADFPNALSAGPMATRALLHYTCPQALESTAKVRHESEGGDNEIVTLFPAGSGEVGKAELFVFHPAEEDGQGRGRVYVEYRQPNPTFGGTRWDQGLAAAGDSRSRTGIIVHTVKDDPASNSPVIWYAGRITFPTADTDVQVDTPFGPVTVSVGPEHAREVNPLWITARITKGIVAPGILLETPPPTDAVVVLSSEKRRIPGWDFLGEFTWERRATTRTEQYIAVTSGLGGAGSIDKSKTITLRWFIGNCMCMNPSGTVALIPTGGVHSVHVSYVLDDAKGILTLSNDPNEGEYSVSVRVEAYDLDWRLSASANSHFDAPGIEEGWGADYQAFARWFYHITHPVPKWRPGPPIIGEVIEQIDEMARLLRDLEHVHSDAARTLSAMQAEFTRSQLRVARQTMLEPYGRAIYAAKEVMQK